MLKTLQLTKSQLLTIFNKYIKSVLIIKNLSKDKIDMKKAKLVNHSLKYMKYIDDIFSSMKHDDANFLKKVFIQKIPRNKFDYSISGYYSKMNQSINEFYKFFDKSVWLAL